MTATSDLLNLTLTMQSAGLVGENVRVAKKKATVKDITKLGIKNIVGIELIKVQGGLISGIV